MIISTYNLYICFLVTILSHVISETCYMNHVINNFCAPVLSEKASGVISYMSLNFKDSRKIVLVKK